MVQAENNDAVSCLSVNSDLQKRIKDIVERVIAARVCLLDVQATILRALFLVIYDHVVPGSGFNDAVYGGWVGRLSYAHVIPETRKRRRKAEEMKKAEDDDKGDVFETFENHGAG